MSNYQNTDVTFNLSIEYSTNILAFSETWLRPDILTDSILLPSFFKPKRKDRQTDPHGGVVIYVKDNIAYTRWHDLELPGIECKWIEVLLKHKR